MNNLSVERLAHSPGAGLFISHDHGIDRTGAKYTGHFVPGSVSFIGH